MKNNPSILWEDNERLRLTTEMAKLIIDNHLTSDSSLMFLAVNRIAAIGAETVDVLEKYRADILAFPFPSAEHATSGHMRSKYVTITTKVDWDMYDGDDSKQRLERSVKVVLPPGQHRFERILNPFPRSEPDFLALPGTKIGVAESYWQRQSGYQHGIWQVSITEDTNE